MKRLVLRLISILAGLVLLTQPIIVSADSTEDLLNVYGLTLGGPIKSDIERQMEALEQELLSKQTSGNMTDEYNAVLSEYISKREQFVDNILNDVAVYQKSNASIANEIENDFLSMSLSELLTLDSRYKTNEKYMNDLLGTMNDYRMDYSYKSFNADITDVESRLGYTQSLYIESIDAYDLGSVKDIEFVLDRDRVVNSGYGYRADPINIGEVRFHAGVDYRAVEGDDIHALFNGVVISTGWSDTIGNFVVVQSGENVKYLVCHCSEICVEDGQLVSQGDVIARVGGTGSRCTGPHLHLALYLNGVTYNPDRLFK